MIWPHQPGFPYKQQIAIGACAVSALAVALMPGLSWLQRAIAPVAVPACFMLSYFFVRILLAIFGLARPVGVIYGFFVFYGMLMASITFIVMFPVIVFDPEISDPVERAYIVANVLPTAMGACAAVLASFRTWANK